MGSLRGIECGAFGETVHDMEVYNKQGPLNDNVGSGEMSKDEVVSE